MRKPIPHLTLEVNNNLDFDVQLLLSPLHSELVGMVAINLRGIKSRAIQHEEYRIVDGNPEYIFVNSSLLIREGHLVGPKTENTTCNGIAQEDSKKAFQKWSSISFN